MTVSSAKKCQQLVRKMGHETRQKTTYSDTRDCCRRLRLRKVGLIPPRPASWSGKRQTEKSALQISFTVTNRTGTSFVGELRQTAGGPAAKMKVEGNLDRNKVAFQTTEMLSGKNCDLGFKGYLLSDRIITNVEGIQVNGKPASGWMSLCVTARTKRK